MVESRPPRAPKRPASEIAARELGLIVFWPLTLHPGGVGHGADEIAERVAGRAAELRRSRPWVPVEDPIEHIARPDTPGQLARWENGAYAEALYFHEFVQDFLYRRFAPGDELIRPFHLFRREDVKRLRVAFKAGEDAKGREIVASKELSVERLDLYLFRTGPAFLVLEIKAPAAGGGTCGWTLAEFQTFHDCFRRLYAPFFHAERAPPRGYVPDCVSWLGPDGKPLGTADGGKAEWRVETSICAVDEFLNDPAPDGRRVPPLFDHWRFLLAEALPLGGAGDVWRPVSDERLPTMALVSLPAMEDYEDVREGDLMRLCFADGAGAGDYPCHEAFLRRRWQEDHVYDRYRCSGTLYLLSGYAFVAVGSGGFFDNVVAEHFRRHYYQMGLLLHFELASLLSFSSQISRAVKELGDRKNRERFAAAMSGIEEQFLHFTHRFRFTGVSNQMQAREMFSLWRRRLELDEIYDDVGQELRAANTFLDAQEQGAQTRAATRLSQVATVGVVLGLAVGALGMNVVFTEGFFGGQTIWSHLAAFCAVVLAASLLARGALGYLGLSDPKLRRLFGLIAFLASAALASVLLVEHAGTAARWLRGQGGG